jgi:hypothetical protein
MMLEKKTSPSKSALSDWISVRKKLAALSEKEILSVVGELFELNKANKDFLKSRFIGSASAIKDFKKRIDTRLCPDPTSRNFKIDLAGARKVVSEFEKSTTDKEALLDLILYYCETGTKFACDYGVDYEQYYDSITSMFGRFLKFIERISVSKQRIFMPRVQALLDDAEHCGYAHFDILSQDLDEWTLWESES